jgi:hypothetical protein
VWEPFHVRKGFKKDESTVSVFQGWSAINSMGAAGCCRPAHEETLIMMQAFPCLRESLTLVMDPLVAQHLKEQGFDHPDQLATDLSDDFKMTVGQFFGSDVVYSLVEPNARAGIEPYASWLELPKEALIAPYASPDRIEVLVIGGETQALWLTTGFWSPRWYRSTDGGPRGECSKRTRRPCVVAVRGRSGTRPL